MKLAAVTDTTTLVPSTSWEHHGHYSFITTSAFLTQYMKASIIGCSGPFLHSYSSGYHQNVLKLRGRDSIMLACQVRKMECQVVIKENFPERHQLDSFATRDSILDLLFYNNLESLSLRVSSLGMCALSRLGFI